MNKTRRVITSIMLLGIGYWIYIWFQPQPLERTYSSIIYSYDQSYAKNIVVKLKGHIYRGLLSPGSFVGELTTDNNNNLNYEIKLIGGKYYSGIIAARDEAASTRSIGIVAISNNFDKFWLSLDDINQRYQLQEGDVYISGPAKNREEAIQIAHLTAAGK